MNEPLGAFLKVYYDSGGFVCIETFCEGALDAAVERWLSSGSTQDTLLDLTMSDGDTYRVRASTITSWVHSTPAGRARATLLEKLSKDETQENRAAVGLYGDDD